jgi:uncharacterized RDD family membrane protein YckC
MQIGRRIVSALLAGSRRISSSRAAKVDLTGLLGIMGARVQNPLLPTQQGDGMSEQKGNLYAPPEARVDDIQAEGELELAGRGTRLGAAIVDSLIQGAVYWLMMLFVFSISFQEMATVAFGKQVLMQTGGIFVFLILNGYFLAKNGQTIAKKLLNIKIVRSDGSAAGLGRIILLRLAPVWLAMLVPYVGMLVTGLVDPLLIFRQSRKCLHDTIADTIVVKA